MPLDSNLFVLLVRPRPSDPAWLDFLVDGPDLPEVLYSAYKDSDLTTYTLYDPHTSSPYGTLLQPPPSLPNATTPNPKLRSINLSSPPVETKLRNVGKLGWEWEFEWEGNGYSWERSVVGLFGSERGFTLNVSRKPDPNYPVVTYHPRKKGGSIEILDYNFARVEPAIEDKKGLEITFLLSLCFFLDPLFATTPSTIPIPASLPSVVAPAQASASPATSRPQPPLPLAPKPPPRPPLTGRKPSGSSRSGSLLTNEIRIDSDSEQALESYCTRCLDLLEDPSLLYLLLTTSSDSPRLSGSLVKLAERVKRKRYKSSGEEIKLFVDDSQDHVEAEDEGLAKNWTKKKVKGAYSPPLNLKIYLSRLELAELLPTHNRQLRKNPSMRPPIRPPINFDEAR
ncbi:hypothetical protein JCM16303_000933 [Sporobolomyces ruberrimus]